MKERLLDVVKWGLILVIAGAVFYAVSPKYKFEGFHIRLNYITGTVEKWEGTKGWVLRVPKPRAKDIFDKILEESQKEEG